MFIVENNSKPWRFYLQGFFYGVIDCQENLRDHVPVGCPELVCRRFCNEHDKEFNRNYERYK